MVNAPVPVPVRTRPGDVPVEVVLQGRSWPVETVQERWRIDEGWWWEAPVSRLYWRLVLANGRLLTVYQDLGDRSWWTQRA